MFDTGIYERGYMYVVYQLLLTTCTGVNGWWFAHLELAIIFYI